MAPWESTEGESKGWGEKFKVYLFIECCIWLPGAYLFCYRFQPTIRFVQTNSGKHIVSRASTLLEQYTPSMHARLSEMAGKIQGAPAGRAAAEWALLNKVLAPIGFPTKLWMAHQIVQRRNAALGTDLTATVPVASNESAS
uniref:Uncharacterized protein n=1 Tax=Haptolina brevifila TaxID=156173 RepID=A0A7S2BWK6_9EUKA|mmetsp:Transcript_17696/g.35681  ORF Transcript_17696/g.35681 Transcript_17696/m.35681 type:complete len:141 (+) Transcript_17696:132-554(+)|eukprot:CAMPEP_0174725996 /NCGR_PEP_ID=MMETSP1094-20130205/46817_1 /TAXON_ID=156173 /ORGANISM="Chrysochromulina brevifilum, Strain UTEX LB 985" /LENGTH=140 /DNA_ID=CAMNT_0015927495 /DNA_START=132 /DNA_END=554 /DNA_ORIENTATION=+